MSPITPVTYTTPDGVARPLRFTFGAMRRVVERLGCPIGEALQKYGEAAMPEILYCCMFDKKGNPPKGLDPVEFAEEADPNSYLAMLEKVHDACPPGRVKNELAALIQGTTKMQALRDLQLKVIGSDSGVSPDSASGSPTENSGNSLQENSTPSPTDTPNSETSGVSTQA